MACKLIINGLKIKEMCKACIVNIRQTKGKGEEVR